MKFYTLDMEWHPETLAYQCGVLYAPGIDIVNTSSCDDFVGEILQNLQDDHQTIFAHYGGGSDFLFLLRELVGRKDVYFNEKKFLQQSSKILTFTVYYKRREYQFRDSYALLPDGLNKLGESFLGKGKTYDSKNLITKEMQMEQCYHDAKMLWDIIAAFMTELKLDHLPFTYSSLALKDMQTRCDFNKIKTQSAEEYQTFLPWFAGGHVDVYRRYAEPCYEYDIKSCYSSAQFDYGCPVGDFKETKKFNSNQAGLYLIKTNCHVWNPFLWVKKDQKLYFVNSTDNYFCITDIELRKLEELGFTYKIYQGFTWELDKDFFKDFVTHWFNYKERGGARRLIAKYMLNGGGYGKWAINRECETIVFGKGADYFINADFQIGVKKEWINFSYSQIHIASRITAGGRIKLFESQGDHVNKFLCYSDTDSVYVSRLCSGLDDQSSLGQLQFKKEYKRCYFLGNKFYCGVDLDLNCKTILKGFPEKFDESYFKNALQGEISFKYAKQKLMKMRSALRTGGEFVHIQNFLREVKKLEIKRKLNPDGITTEPFTLKGDELL